MWLSVINVVEFQSEKANNIGIVESRIAYTMSKVPSSNLIKIKLNTS